MSTISFSDEQLQIINHTHGGLLVLAPVGTGKTSVLSERVAKAIEHGISPGRILCLTFTNRAAKEMGDRIAQAHPHIYRDLTIKTFHGLCARMLRIEAETIGLPTDFVIYDDPDCFEILANISQFQKSQDVRNLLNAIADCKSKANQQQLSLQFPLSDGFAALSVSDRSIALKYQAELSDRHALDFADLIFYTRAMLHLTPETAERWQNRFDLVQVDEVQDTHLGEYEIVSHLATQSGNLALIGDLDQTIYGWRGSAPEIVLERFNAEFHPAQCSLSLNYRATQTLLNAASAFADTFEERHTSIIPSPTCDVGDKISIHTASDEDEEAYWIASQIKDLASGVLDFRYNRLAILTRTNKRSSLVASVLEEFDIPCITVEQYNFFMRQEVKDALAYLRFIINPFDTGAFKRLLLSPNRDISLKKLRSVYAEGKLCGLRLTDFAMPQPFVNDDPLGAVIENHNRGTIVVFDVETTGLSVGNDIIEIAAIKLVNGQQVDEFHVYISDASDVGESYHIHGYSNDFLQQNGIPARSAFERFSQFVEGFMLIGHNVGFDIKMAIAHSQKVGAKIPSCEWADTWNLAQRFIQAERYNLASLATQLNLPSTPNHHAMDDVITTIQLLDYLIPLLEAKQSDRQALYYKEGELFAPLAEEIADWKALSQQLRPAELLTHILQTSGLASHYAGEGERTQNLNRLLEIFQQRDDVTLHPDTALRSILEFTALAKNLDHISERENQVVIVTVHQSKGLEFDHVFLAGMTEDEFPSFFSVRDGNIEEEKRLFYVALTRAKTSLYVSCYTQVWKREKTPSAFLFSLPAESTKWN